MSPFEMGLKVLKKNLTKYVPRNLCFIWVHKPWVLSILERDLCKKKNFLLTTINYCCFQTILFLFLTDVIFLSFSHFWGNTKPLVRQPELKLTLAVFTINLIFSFRRKFLHYTLNIRGIKTESNPRIQWYPIPDWTSEFSWETGWK